MLTMVNLSSVLAKVSHAKCTAHVCLAPEASVTVVGVYCSCECMARKNVYGYVRFALRRFPHVTVGFLLSLERSPSRSLRILAHILLPLIPSLTSLTVPHSLPHSLPQALPPTDHSHSTAKHDNATLTPMQHTARPSAAPEEFNATKRSLQRLCRMRRARYKVPELRGGSGRV